MTQAFQQYVPRAGNLDSVGDGLPVLGFITPERHGAKGGTADDTTKLQSAIGEAQETGKILFPSQPYNISAELVISDAVKIAGTGCSPLFGDRTVWASDVTPTVSPWLKGAQFIQNTAGANCFRVTASGKAVHLSDFGMRWADAIRFRNTGHGISCDPPAYETIYKNNGMDGSRWSSLFVHGHDGNHYGYLPLNAQLCVFDNLHSYGGGHLWWRSNTGGTRGANYGNSTVINSYGMVVANGSAYGYLITGDVGGHGSILLHFVRPQIFMVDSVAAGDLADFHTWYPSDLSLPATAQGCFFADDNTFGLAVIDPDMETLTGKESIRLPTDMSGNAWINPYCPGSQYHKVSILGGTVKVGALSINGISVPAPSGGQATASGDLNPMTTSYLLVPGLTTGGNLAAGTYDVTACLRWFNTGGSNAQMAITDSAGNILSPEFLMYSGTTANEQGAATLRARITVDGTKTLQTRAKSAAGGGIVLHDAAGTCVMNWNRVL